MFDQAINDMIITVSPLLVFALISICVNAALRKSFPYRLFLVKEAKIKAAYDEVLLKEMEKVIKNKQHMKVQFDAIAGQNVFVKRKV